MDIQRAFAKYDRLLNPADTPAEGGTHEIVFVVSCRIKPILSRGTSWIDSIDSIRRPARCVITSNVDLVVGADMKGVQATKPLAPRIDVGISTDGGRCLLAKFKIVRV